METTCPPIENLAMKLYLILINLHCYLPKHQDGIMHMLCLKVSKVTQGKGEIGSRIKEPDE